MNTLPTSRLTPTAPTASTDSSHLPQHQPPPPPPHHFHPQPSPPPFCKHYSLSNHRPSPVTHPTSLYHHCTDTHITALHGTSPLTFTLCTMHWRICILRVTFDLLLLFLSPLLLLSFSFRHRQRKQSSKAEQNFPHGHCILVNSSGQIQVKTAPVLLQPILLKLHCSDFFFCTPCLCLLFVPFSFSPRNHISLFLHVFSRPLGVIYLCAPAYITAIASAGPTTHFRPLVHNFAVFSP